MTDTSSSKRPLLVILSVISFIATLAIAGYFYQQQKNVGDSKKANADTPKTTALAETKPVPAAVLTDLFGVETSADKVANAENQLSSLWFEQTFTHNKDKFNAVFVKTQSLDPDSKEVIDSHASEANISVVVYKLVGEEWELFSKQLNVGSFGSWGDVPDVDHVPTLRLSPDNIVFLIDGGFTGQGYVEEGKGLFSYNIKDKIWKDLGYIQTGGDNAGACDDSPQPADSVLSACWEYSGKITIARSSKNRIYPDLLVIAQGTTSDDNNKIIHAENHLYVFNGEQYVEAGAEAR